MRQGGAEVDVYSSMGSWGGGWCSKPWRKPEDDYLPSTPQNRNNEYVVYYKNIVFVQETKMDYA